ncbi:uncharacterized protein EV154DRAFT_450422 [Mucor mucedo]|uniref:uncharacterized protein n=1 Tax=Mucor mucedo TaxID=29922 RepID=UPI00221FE7AE|nr:uncharacterized protein EV154DRAFT_450422 [Mucor mucedo]KAI7881740.1 hypothetical protein EV154DRAFT_450422 [Mucor mucedo]
MPLFSKKIVPTDITASIEKATYGNELDWALVFQICDSVNSTDLGAKEARKLLQKKMMSNDPNTQVLALEILNSLAENCTAKFQTQLAAKSFGEDLYHLASSKTMDDRVHGKLAQCLETWYGQFGNDVNFGAIRRAHDIMLNHVTPKQGRQPSLPRQPVDVKGDIELAKNSAQLFSQTLSFTDPTVEDISKNELIQEFYGKCKQAQQLLASHLETCEDSDVISGLINANNELLSCFKSYDEMLEQHAVNEATVNSQTLYQHTRGQDQIVPCPTATVLVDDKQMKPQPDQLALQEWFAKKDDFSHSNKDRVVIDWMNDVERSSKNIFNKIQFKSDAGKRWANSITSNTSLLPPDDTCRKHYVPRRLLLSRSPILGDYQTTNRPSAAMVENQIAMTAMATSGQRTPILGLAQLIGMIMTSNKQLEQRLVDRAEELESVLHQEIKKRQLVEDTMHKLESVYKEQLQQQSLQMDQKEETNQTLLAQLEQAMKRDPLFTSTNLSSTPSNNNNRKRPSVLISSKRPPPPSSATKTKRPSTSVKPSTPTAVSTRKPSSLLSKTQPMTAQKPVSGRASVVPSSKTALLSRPSVVPVTRPSPNPVTRPSLNPVTRPTPTSRRPTVVPSATLASKKQTILNSTRALGRPSLAVPKKTTRLL